MKVLLINPSRIYYQGSKGPRIGLPLGLMYIAAMLEKKSIPVKIFDSLNSSGTRIIEQSDYVHHGVSDDFLKDIISNQKPDIVGISNPFSAQIENTIRVANLVKQANPNIFVVVGGPHFAVKGKQFLEENKNVDVVVSGEGEYVMLELIEKLKNKKSFKNISGLIFRSQGLKGQTQIIANPPKLIKELNLLPFPAYDLIDMDRYFHFLQSGLSTRPSKHQRSISMISSRGCPFNCIFCAIHLHMGKPWRAHSVDYIISHIEHLVNNYKVKHISFEDDNFTFNPRRCENIIDQILEKKFNISWDTPNGVRADGLNKNLLAKMKKSNCRELLIAAESGDQNVLDNIIKKNLRLSKVIQVAAWCKKLKIKLKSAFIIGLPGETKIQIQKTVDFSFWLYKKFNVKPALMIATPLFGTQLHKTVTQNNYLVEDITPKSLALATQTRGRGLIKTSEFTPQDLKKFAQQLDSKVARLDLLKKIINPCQYFKSLKLFLIKPNRLIFYLKRLKG